MPLDRRSLRQDRQQRQGCLGRYRNGLAQNLPILIAAYTQGGTPTAAQIEAAFARIGRMVAGRLA